ncbi:unnamed protein product [Symbiodinium sp. CCMP2592]|nr:unnamed protein product [Symbiodinium sp. CCMP2592]
MAGPEDPDEDWAAFASQSLEDGRREESLQILSQDTSEADACRSSASDEGDDPVEMAAPFLPPSPDDEDVPLKPSNGDAWWVKLLKTHTANKKPGGVVPSGLVTVLSACSGGLTEGFVLQEIRHLRKGTDLGIDFKVVSVSDPCRAYREFCCANHDSIEHVHLNMSDQIHGAACEKHSHAESCVIHDEPMLAVLGTPCPPFSVQRAKRFKSGTVKHHKSYNTTFESALLFLETFNPVTAVLEQVPGFDQLETAGDSVFLQKLSEADTKHGYYVAVQRLDLATAAAPAPVAPVTAVVPSRGSEGCARARAAKAAKIANVRQQQLDADELRLQHLDFDQPLQSGLLQYRRIGSDLQQKLLLEATRRLSGEQTSSTSSNASNAYVQKLLHKLRPVMSFTAQAVHGDSDIDDNRHNAKNSLLRAAAAIMDGAKMVCGNFFCVVQDAMQNGAELLLLVKKRRYDETPLRLRAKARQEDDDDEKAKPMKVIQSEMSVGVLLKRCDKFMFVKTVLPSQLHVADAVTAETLRECQQRLEDIPELARLALNARLKLQLVVTDRAASNIKCESGIQLHDATWTKAHVFCKVHKVAQQQSATSKLCDGHISGLVSLALGMQMAGSTNKMRKCLMVVLRKRVRVHVGTPPLDPARDEYRNEVYDLCLSKCCTRADRAEHEAQQANRLRQKQRLVFEHFFHGSDFRQYFIDLFIPQLRTLEDIWKELETSLVPYLLPHRCPMFHRSRWTGGDLALDWMLLMSLTFDLMSEVVPMWAGADIPSGPPGHAAGAAEAEEDCWESLCQDLVPSAEVGEGGQQQQLSWAEFNAAMKKKAAEFAIRKPAGALALLRSVMELNFKLLYHALHVSSDAWQNEQAAKASNVPCSRILDEYAGKHVHRFADELQEAFMSVPKAIPPAACARNMRTLHFRLLSRAGAAHHQLLERFRCAFPTQMFGALLGNTSVLTAKPCLLDELSTKVRQMFGTPSLLGSAEARAVLASIAELWELDIAAIEAKHASVRRALTSRGVQAPQPFLSVVSADFVVQQCARQNLQHSSWKDQQSARLGRFSRRPQTSVSDSQKQNAADSDAEEAGHESENKKKKRKQEHGSKPGGKWKAFCAVNAKGKQINKEVGKELSDQYHNLQPEDDAWYQELGEMAKAAGLAGHKPFPKQPAADQGVLVHAPEHLTSALCALGSDLRKQSAARVARSKQIQDAISDMAPFDKLSPEHKEAVQTVCNIREADRQHFKRSSSQADSMAMLHWIPPVAPFAEAALADPRMRGRGATAGLKTGLGEAWEKCHNMIVDETLPRIKDSELADLFQATECHRLSLCVCHGRGEQAKLCCDKTIQLIRPLLAVKKRTRGPDNKFIEKEPERTRARMLAESAELIVCFSEVEEGESKDSDRQAEHHCDGWADFLMGAPAGQTGSCIEERQVPLPMEPSDKIWFHFGYVNFRSWESTGLCLHDCPSDSDSGGEAGQEGRHESLQTLVVHDEEVVFRTLLETMHAKMDLNRSWHAELYEIVSLPILVRHANMKPDRVQVRAMRMSGHEAPLLVWKGAAAEKAEREAAEQAKRTRDQRAQAKPKQQRGAEPRLRPHLPALMVQQQQASHSAVQPEPGDQLPSEPAPPSPDFPDGVPDQDLGECEVLDFGFDLSDSETEATPAWLKQASEIIDLELLAASALDAEEDELLEENKADDPQGRMAISF